VRVSELMLNKKYNKMPWLSRRGNSPKLFKMVVQLIPYNRLVVT
jgi:hypothetical protein